MRERLNSPLKERERCCEAERVYPTSSLAVKLLSSLCVLHDLVQLTLSMPK